MALLLVQGVLVFAGAPLLAGISRQLKARLQYRRGPSIWQPYRDLRKWWAKDAVQSDATSALTGLVPVLVLATMAAAVLLLPILSVSSLAPGTADVLVIVGLLALARLALALLALDAGGAFGGMGSSREVAIAALAEPGLVLALAVAAISGGSTDLSVLAAHGLELGPALLGAPMLLAAAAYAIVAIAETGHEPVDNPDAHLEVTMIHEGMILEASGRRLAMLTYAGHLKFIVVAGIFAAVFLPYGMLDDGRTLTGLGAPGGAGPVGVVVALAAAVVKLIAATIGLGLLDAGLAKARILVLPSLLGLAALLAVTAVAAYLWFPT